MMHSERKHGYPDRLSARDIGWRVGSGAIVAAIVVSVLCYSLITSGDGRSSDATNEIVAQQDAGQSESARGSESSPIESSEGEGPRLQDRPSVESSQATSPSAGGAQEVVLPSEVGTGNLWPRPGRYRYRSEGRIVTSFGPYSDNRPLPPYVEALITAQPDCWQWTVTEVGQNEEMRQYCPLGSGLRSVGGLRKSDALRTYVESSVVCASYPVVRVPSVPGESWAAHCDLQNSGMDNSESTMQGTVTHIGDDSIVVAGNGLACWHIREEWVLSGTQEGREVRDHWIVKGSGLIAREAIESNVTARTAIGSVSQTSNMDFTLSEAEPQS